MKDAICLAGGCVCRHWHNYTKTLALRPRVNSDGKQMRAEAVAESVSRT